MTNAWPRTPGGAQVEFSDQTLFIQPTGPLDVSDRSDPLIGPCTLLDTLHIQINCPPGLFSCRKESNYFSILYLFRQHKILLHWRKSVLQMKSFSSQFPCLLSSAQTYKSCVQIFT